MMRGVVNSALEATVRLSVRNTDARSHEFEAVIDTGFNGFLTLPHALIAALRVPWLYRQQGQLADGSLQIFDVYAATIVWDGQPRVVEVEAGDPQALIGMSLMQGYELRVHVASGGEVSIRAAPSGEADSGRLE